jgi:tetratricopeptide (TPR) repeat protein
MIPKGREKDRPLLEKALASALYKQAEELRNQGKLSDAAQVFTRVGLEVPDTATAPVALYDAASVYTQLGDRDKAIQVYRILSQKYPDSPYVETSLVHWAELLRDQGSYLESARTFEKAASSSGRDQTVRESASFLAGLLYEKAGDWESAQKAFARYRNAFPDGNRVVEAVFRAGKVREHLPDPGGALDYYREVVSLQQRLRNPAPEVITLAAQAQFAIAEERKVRFEEVRLVSPLEKNLGRKKTLLKEALEGYTATAKYKISEMTTASAYRMGEILEHFRDALLTSERPRDLKPEQLEQYDFLLEEQAYPFEEKAVNAYESNVRRAQETGTFDRWVQESYGRLAVLLPAQYQRRERGDRLTGELNADSLAQVEIPALLNSAGIYFREKGDFSKAEEFYQRAIRIDPAYHEALFNLGVLHEIYLNNPGAAVENYRAYLKAAPLRSGSGLSPGGEVKTVNGETAGQPGEKENLLRQVELWITALEKRMGGNHEPVQTP